MHSSFSRLAFCMSGLWYGASILGVRQTTQGWYDHASPIRFSADLPFVLFCLYLILQVVLFLQAFTVVLNSAYFYELYATFPRDSSFISVISFT